MAHQIQDIPVSWDSISWAIPMISPPRLSQRIVNSENQVSYDFTLNNAESLKQFKLKWLKLSYILFLSNQLRLLISRDRTWCTNESVVSSLWNVHVTDAVWEFGYLFISRHNDLAWRYETVYEKLTIYWRVVVSNI